MTTRRRQGNFDQAASCLSKIYTLLWAPFLTETKKQTSTLSGGYVCFYSIHSLMPCQEFLLYETFL